MELYLFVFAQIHEEFRLPELHSIAELHGIELGIPENSDPSRPFALVHLESEEHAKILASRCILVKSVYEFYARGSTYEEMHTRNREARHLWERYAADTSFKFLVNGYNHSITQRRQREVVEGFDYMDFLGKIDMKNPEITLGCFEEYGDPRKSERAARDGHFREVFFGRLIMEGTARDLIGKFNVKKRSYYGNTSMESEISLLMANQTMAQPGSLVYDPFMGTGSMAYTTAHFGAYVYGSDIDGRQMRGKEKQPGVIRAAAQYGVAPKIMDLCTFDVTHNPWRCGGLFDAIVTDPPYGVRAGAKRLGRRNPRPDRPQIDPAERRPDQPYIPPTSPYELSALATDLVVLARYLLKPGGRLVFFLPTVTDEYEEVDIQSFMCEGMEIVANSLQDFGSWGRRLITLKKTGQAQYPVPIFAHVSAAESEDGKHTPAHKDFREKYFKGFRKDGEGVAE